MFICRFVCLPLDARSCGCLQIYIYIQFGNSLIAKTNPPSSGLMTVYNFFPTHNHASLGSPCLVLPCNDIAPPARGFQTGLALALLMSRVRAADDVDVSATSLASLPSHNLYDSQALSQPSPYRNATSCLPSHPYLDSKLPFGCPHIPYSAHTVS